MSHPSREDQALQRWRAEVDWITQAGGSRTWAGEVEAATAAEAIEAAGRAARISVPALFRGAPTGQVVDVRVDRIKP